MRQLRYSLLTNHSSSHSSVERFDFIIVCSFFSLMFIAQMAASIQTTLINFQPPHVVKALQTISRATPFEVRFKKCHTERGRVFAVDASLKTGTDYDLKLYIEYPLGSGQVGECTVTST